MSRKILYPALALVALGPPLARGGALGFNEPVLKRPFAAALQQFSPVPPVFIPPTSAPLTNGGQFPQPPDLFKKPFPAALQQYDATPWQGLVPTAPTPQGWQGFQLEYRFAKPFQPNEQQWVAYIPEHVPVAEDVQGFYPQPPDLFAKPFPAALQQFNAFTPQGRITSTFPDGWRGLQWEYRFATPFPATAQQYLTHLARLIPTPTPIRGFYPQPPDRFAKPFPAALQQYDIKAPQPILSLGPTAYLTQDPIAFKAPFPVTQQLYSTWDLVGDVPIFRPPGAGKRYKAPTAYLPEPAFDAKPNKPFQPIWDKQRQDEEEARRRAAEEAARPVPAGPPPLPPADIFGAAPSTGMFGLAGADAAVPQGLPTFDHLVPPDTAAFGNRMQEAQDMSDAMAVLKALGLFREG